MNEQTTVHALYTKLLRLYPRWFRERLAESMEQTFSDLINEKRQTKQGLFRFALWTFAETTGGIIREHISLVRQGDIMQTFSTNLRLPALISLLLVFPFMIMEVVNRRNFNQGFPIPLFVILWLLPVIFILILTPIVRNIRAGNHILARPINLLLSVTFLVLIAIVWTGALIDQMPCFLGVPNCD